jgi:hypothetical protein
MGMSCLRLRRVSVLVLGAFVVPFGIGCEPAGPAGATMFSCPSDTAGVQSAILIPACGSAGCHGATGPALGLDLSSPELASRVSGVAAVGCGDRTLVVPGNPGQSYLFDKMVNLAPACGERMPLGTHPLDSEAVDCLMRWVSNLPAAGTGGASGSGGSGSGSGGTSGATGGATGTATGGRSGSGGAPTGTGGQTTATGGRTGSGGGISSTGGALASGGRVGTGGQPSSSGGATGSGGASGTGGCGTSVSFGGQVQPIFTASCANQGCHTGTRPSAGVSLAAGAAYAELVNVASSCAGRLLVRPGVAAQSYLMDKLYGTNLCSGSQMPKAGSSLPAAQLAIISTWICQGAPKN